MDRDKLRLFVYGSLKRDEYNWHIIRQGVEECLPARLAGTMWLRSDGYPALLLPPSDPPPRLGTENYPSDLRAAWDETGIGPVCSDHWIEGQLLILNPGTAWLRRLDEFEGFFPGSTSEYLRVLTALEVPARGWAWAWTYTAALKSPPSEWPQIATWNRLLAKDLLPYRHGLA